MSRKVITASACMIGGCVGVRFGKEKVSVQNTKRPKEEVSFSREEWTAFIAGAKNREFDIK